MKYLPTDVSSFRTMISRNYIYVDKTEYIYNLFKGGARYYFLSRPRRFGKTLLISTLKEFFLGNKELFKNLKVYNLDYNWQNYPVIHLDFSTIGHKTSDQLENELQKSLLTIAKEYEINVSYTSSSIIILKDLVKELSKKYGYNSVVILIDEYDKPILDNLVNYENAEMQKQVLRSFYDVLKGLDEYLRAIFITGVSRFSKTSIFSGINNLNDISLKPEAACLLGYTKEEISNNFGDFINKISKDQAISSEEIMAKMEFWYNGYRFSRDKVKVYNPFSVLYYLKDKRFNNYWFESGTPSFLIDLLKKQYYEFKDLDDIELSESSLGSFELNNIPVITLMFQTGYLTIRDYSEATNKFKLSFPNEEVKESLKPYLDTISLDYIYGVLSLDCKTQNI